jgi:DNA-binding NarL/FixJ family response regulator
MPIRILIADDHVLIRAGLRALLKDVPDMEVLGEAEDGQAVLRLAAELQPDIAVLDINMPGVNGVEATRRLTEISPQTRVLALTMYEDEGMLREMIHAGAQGYIIKRAVDADLIHAIRAVYQGYMYVHPALMGTVLRDLVPHKSTHQEKQAEALTPREIDVLLLIARGYTNRQIAQKLNLSPRTVEGHRASLVGKLGFSSRVELMNYVEEHGLTDSKK